MLVGQVLKHGHELRYEPRRGPTTGGKMRKLFLCRKTRSFSQERDHAVRPCCKTMLSLKRDHKSRSTRELCTSTKAGASASLKICSQTDQTWIVRPSHSDSSEHGPTDEVMMMPVWGVWEMRPCTPRARGEDSNEAMVMIE
mmetsp:Transcript_19498/g.23359  ORF Transcript_19498/g.23359 Transcript_19498/m.23359 type:complete len:141 (+) Transcript_19498:841-1263(+)